MCGWPSWTDESGRASPYTDLHLLLLDRPWLNWTRRADPHDAFDASVLPFPVDVIDLKGLAEGDGLAAQRVLDEACQLR